MVNRPEGCLGFLFHIFGLDERSRSPKASLPKVHVNKYFVTTAEADFFRVLCTVVGERGHVLAQVSLRQLVWFPGNNQSNPGRQIWQNKVAAKSLDFVVCDPATLKPKLVVELDEPSHARPDRQARDEDVDRVLEAAGLPVVRVLTSRLYNTRSIEEVVGPYLAGEVR